MKPTVYIETTIPSYLTAWPSSNLQRSSDQLHTKQWWRTRDSFDLRISQLVWDECSSGDPEAAAARLAAIKEVPLLLQTEEADRLAEAIVRLAKLPPKASDDAMHISLATVHGCMYLLTWNCTHIANPSFRPLVESVCRAFGYDPPSICTPAMMNDSGVKQ